MNQFLRILKSPAALIVALLPAFVAGCGGGMDPVLGTPAVATVTAPTETTRPTVTLTTPADGALNVAADAQITATFSEAMDPATIKDTSFTVTNTTLGSTVPGTVTYSASTNTATFAPTGGALASNNQFVATITSAATDLAGNALAGNTAIAPAAGDHVWSFATAGVAPPVTDTTRPTVTLTAPTDGTLNASTNTLITATFSEAMDPATIKDTSFSVTNTTLGSAVPGTVTYSASARTATFAPTGGVLASNNQFVATITLAATDLAGNALAGNTAIAPAAGDHVWSFGTGGVSDLVAPTVTSISPADASTGICRSKSVSATFSEPMDAATITSATLGVSANGVAVPGVVTYDAPSQVASFVPADPNGFAASTTYLVTVKSGVNGVKDLAGNALVTDRTWTFATGTQACIAPVNLRSAASFGAFGGAAGVTNQGINSVVGGNLGTTAACTLITGFHDSNAVYTQTPLNVGAVNGTIYCAPPAPGTAVSMAIATQARADALSAYNYLAALPAGSDPGAGQLGGLVLSAGVYTAAGGTFAVTTGDLTLDAQGDSNAIWVFQSASALTVGLGATPRRVLLVNGAQAGNVFWKVGSAARIEDGSVIVGTIIAPAGVTISTAGQTAQTTLIGRALGLTASVTMVNTTIVAP